VIKITFCQNAQPVNRKYLQDTILHQKRPFTVSDIPEGAKFEFHNCTVSAIGETLAVEVAQFSIKVLIVEPGAFKTEGIHSQKFFASNPIAAYNEMRKTATEAFGSIYGTQKGDPDKAMEAVVDVVRGEGKAKGRPWPLYLALGDDADEAIRQKSAKLLKHVDGWGDVIKSVNFDT
jgi:hypothetical protein